MAEVEVLLVVALLDEEEEEAEVLLVVDSLDVVDNEVVDGVERVVDFAVMVVGVVWVLTAFVGVGVVFGVAAVVGVKTAGIVKIVGAEKADGMNESYPEI